MSGMDATLGLPQRLRSHTTSVRDGTSAVLNSLRALFAAMVIAVALVAVGALVDGTADCSQLAATVVRRVATATLAGALGTNWTALPTPPHLARS